MNFFSNKRNLVFIFIAIYAGSMLWVSTAWYGNFTSFHFFDDLFEWEYLDKLGHFFNSFQISLFLYKTLGDSQNLNPSLRRKWICFSGFFLMLPIEILDGFSPNYGFSPADFAVNFFGSAFCYAYVSYKFASCFTSKYSFHPTAFSLIRPEMLGSTFAQQVLKDYNGQTQWISIDINSVLNQKIFPSWLLFSVGYGAEGLLGGHDNVWQNAEGKTIDYSTVARTKRFFISVDINTNALRAKNKMFNYLFAPFLLIKFPAPALEINAERGIIFHPVYF